MKNLLLLTIVLILSLTVASSVYAKREQHNQSNVVVDHVAGELPETQKVEGLTEHNVIDVNDEPSQVEIKGGELNDEDEEVKKNNNESRLGDFSVLCQKLSVVLCLHQR